MCIGIQINTNPAIARPIVHKSDILTATQPIIGGEPPHSPPKIIFVLEFRFSTYEYTITLFSNPNAMKTVAQIPCSNVVVNEIANARTSEIPANASPKFLALTAG